ncbi:MAG: riboflavin kinase, partial [Legionellaceae bacterium]
DDFCLNDTRVSSTSIRRALAQGDLVRASEDLNRSYAISGRVIKGQGLGRQWGIPTANIHLARLSPALTGIFFVRVTRAKEDNTFYYGVANLGTRPTVGGFLTVLEVHVFDFDGSLYHERLEVVFLCKLRTEQTFSSIEALIAQIHLDISQAKAMLSHFAV